MVCASMRFAVVRDPINLTNFIQADLTRTGTSSICVIYCISSTLSFIDLGSTLTFPHNIIEYIW